jgi:hypothetical protein
MVALDLFYMLSKTIVRNNFMAEQLSSLEGVTIRAIAYKKYEFEDKESHH